MNDRQRAMLLDLISEWAGIVHESAAAARMAEIKADINETWFAWSGPTTATPGQQHHSLLPDSGAASRDRVRAAAAGRRSRRCTSTPCTAIRRTTTAGSSPANEDALAAVVLLPVWAERRASRTGSMSTCRRPMISVEKRSRSGADRSDSGRCRLPRRACGHRHRRGRRHLRNRSSARMPIGCSAICRSRSTASD